MPKGRTARAVRAGAALAVAVGLTAPGSAAGSATASAFAATRPQQDRLSSVSCVNPTACVAVGLTIPANSSTIRTLSQRWNGKTWAKIPSPNPGGQAISMLTGVSCTSATNCLAVGSSLTSLSSNGTRALMEQWNGKTWSILAAPDPTHSLLAGVTCTSATSCFAVGSAIERWNGKNWSFVKTPNAVSLSSVSCSNPSSCFAVGTSGAERWNGKTWSAVSTPTTGQEPSQFFSLTGVSCTSATTCFAAGSKSEPTAGESPVTEQWNGKSWSTVVAPSPPNAAVAFSSVSCASTTSCFAVGASSDSSGSQFTWFIDRWDGTAWSVVATPSPGAGNATLVAVSCTSATGCFAVGSFVRPFVGDTRVLVEHWDGTTWSVSGPSSAGST